MRTCARQLCGAPYIVAHRFIIYFSRAQKCSTHVGKVACPNLRKESMIKYTAVMILASILTSVAMGQTGAALNEAAKATSQSAQSVGDEVKASGQSGNKKETSKIKADMHKAKAKSHRQRAKHAVDAATNK